MLILYIQSYIFELNMIDSNVRKKENEKLDYSKLPKELENIIEPVSDITEKEAKINFDGKQFLVRFPKDIAKAIGVRTGDKIRFKIILPSPKSNQKEEIELQYIRGKDIEE